MGSYFKKTDLESFYVVRETPRSDKFFIRRWEHFILFDEKLTKQKLILEFFCLDNFQRSDLGPTTRDQRTGPRFHTYLVMKRQFRNQA